MNTVTYKQLPGWCSGKEFACNTGDTEDKGLTPESERSPGGGISNPLQYSCLDNPMNRGAWWATVHQVSKSQTQLSTHARTTVSGKRTGLETSFLSLLTFDPSLAKTG